MTLEFRTYRSSDTHQALQVTEENIREVYEMLRDNPAIYEAGIEEKRGYPTEVRVRKTPNSSASTLMPGEWLSSDFVRINKKMSTWEDITTEPAEPEKHGTYLVSFKRISTEKQHVYVNVDDLLEADPDFLNDLYAEAKTHTWETPVAQLLEQSIIEIISEHDLPIQYDGVLEDDAEEVSAIPKEIPF